MEKSVETVESPAQKGRLQKLVGHVAPYWLVGNAAVASLSAWIQTRTAFDKHADKLGLFDDAKKRSVERFRDLKDHELHDIMTSGYWQGGGDESPTKHATIEAIESEFNAAKEQAILKHFGEKPGLSKQWDIIGKEGRKTVFKGTGKALGILNAFGAVFIGAAYISAKMDQQKSLKQSLDNAHETLR